MIEEKNSYKVGIYARLSNDTGVAEDSTSIENQISMLKDYAKNKRWTVAKKYIDSGYSGVNFERPAFQDMLKDVREKVTDLILVKDLSRLGRNYILLGELLEKTLPELDCRLIAINNNIDTLYPNNAAMDLSGFINLFNQHYSKSTSEKVKAVRKSLAEQGKFLGTYAPYGYVKDPENKYKLIPDSTIVPVVQEIFKMRARGQSYRSIAMELNRNGIPSPRALYYLREHRENIKKENGLWSDSTVRGMIHSEVYLGNTVQMKKGTISFKNKKVQAKETDKWIKVKNTHEAIIDQGLWDVVSQMSRKDFRIKKPKDNEAVSVFVGLLHCGDCGFNMRSLMEKRINKAGEEKRYISFMCNNYSRSGKSACTMHSISERKLKQWILDEIKRLAKVADENPDKFLQEIRNGKNLSLQNKTTSLRERLNVLISEIEFLQKVFEQIFEDSYEIIAAQYDERLQKAIQEKKQIENLLNFDKKSTASITSSIESLNKHKNNPELTREMLIELIDHIDVYEKSTCDGGRNIKIFWKN